jgi:hypothetical protein
MRSWTSGNGTQGAGCGGSVGGVGRPAFAVLATVAALTFHAQDARAGYPVQPIGHSVAGQPTLLVYVDDGETLPQVTVADNPDMTGYEGSCFPSTPFSEPHKYTCQLLTTLRPGTYYWTFSWWKDDNCQTFFGSTYCYTQQHTTAPFSFTVVPPEPPSNAGLTTPYDGAVVASPPVFTVQTPVGSVIHIYVANSAARLSDGSPAGFPLYSCDGTATSTSTYCTDNDAALLTPGQNYYWWATIEVAGTPWIYGPRSFRLRQPNTPTGGTGTAGGKGASTGTTHDASYAPYLQSSNHFAGSSVRNSRLSDAAYSLSKILGVPKTIAVACWSANDWPNVSGDSGDTIYSTLAFWSPLMPHWVHLSPAVCRAMETLLYHRPQYANRITANAVQTLTHEMMHALGIRNEAMAECFGMQLSIILAVKLGVPYQYANSLSHYNLTNYRNRPPNYINTSNCREDGTWDIFKGHDSPPWHTYRP